MSFVSNVGMKFRNPIENKSVSNVLSVDPRILSILNSVNQIFPGDLKGIVGSNLTTHHKEIIPVTILEVFYEDYCLDEGLCLIDLLGYHLYCIWGNFLKKLPKDQDNFKFECNELYQQVFRLIPDMLKINSDLKGRLPCAETGRKYLQEELQRLVSKHQSLSKILDLKKKNTRIFSEDAAKYFKKSGDILKFLENKYLEHAPNIVLSDGSISEIFPDLSKNLHKGSPDKYIDEMNRYISYLETAFSKQISEISNDYKIGLNLTSDLRELKDAASQTDSQNMYKIIAEIEQKMVSYLKAIDRKLSEIGASNGDSFKFITILRLVFSDVQRILQQNVFTPFLRSGEIYMSRSQCAYRIRENLEWFFSDSSKYLFGSSKNIPDSVKGKTFRLFDELVRKIIDKIGDCQKFKNIFKVARPLFDKDCFWSHQVEEVRSCFSPLNSLMPEIFKDFNEGAKTLGLASLSKSEAQAIVLEASVPFCRLLMLANDCDRLKNFDDTGCLMKDELDLLPKELREFLLSFENVEPNREEIEEIVSESDEISDSSSVNSEETETVAADPSKKLLVEDLSVPRLAASVDSNAASGSLVQSTAKVYQAAIVPPRKNEHKENNPSHQEAADPSGRIRFPKNMKRRKLIQRLKELGVPFIGSGKGSHLKYRGTVVPHKSVLGEGLLNAISKQIYP